MRAKTGTAIGRALWKVLMHTIVLTSRICARLIPFRA